MYLSRLVHHRLHSFRRTLGAIKDAGEDQEKLAAPSFRVADDLGVVG
jgi:hypothetical protein